jgi:AcrR family transcriptional regulator
MNVQRAVSTGDGRRLVADAIPLDDLEAAADGRGAGDGNEPITPTTSRGRRTRERLLAAASEVFERDGYIGAKITDITATAGVSSGTFYTYFRSKAEILAALIDRVNREMYVATSASYRHTDDDAEKIHLATRAYVQAYRKNAGMLGILEQVATFNPEFREMRRMVRQTFRNRIERGLRRMSSAGIIDLATHPRSTAEALTSMVSNFCYVSMVLGENYDDADGVETLTTLWLRGIGHVACRDGGAPPRDTRRQDSVGGRARSAHS